MNRQSTLALVMALLPITSIQADEPAAQQATTTSNVEQLLSDAIERGKMLYEFDQAAWHSTDAFVALAPDMAKLSLAGRIIVPVEGGLQAIYYGKSEKGRFAVFHGTWNGKVIVDSVYSKGESGAPLSPDAIAYAEIVELVTSGTLDTKDLWFCNKAQPNHALLPGNAPGEFLLYFMTAQDKKESYPLGGHHRFDIKDRKVVARRTFTKSCIAMNKGDGKREAVGFVISHLLDPVPTEIHVFTAIASGKAVFVSTKSGMVWNVEPSGGTARIQGIDLGEKEGN